MSNRFLQLMEAYRSRPESDGDESLWDFARKRDPYLFSHHPPGPKFRDHVWNFGGLYFCKGCVMTFAGALAGVLGFAVFRWLYWLTDSEVGIVFGLLLLPTVVGHLLKLPRGFRHVARFLLGFLMVSAVAMLFVTDSWLVRGVIVGCYFAAKIPLERKRNRENRRIADGNGRG